MVHMGWGGDGIFCCWGREVGRIGLQQNLLPWDIANNVRKFLMTTLGIQQQGRNAEVDLGEDAGPTEGHIHPIVEAVEIDGPLQLLPLMVEDAL